jgi:hypothetical protein
VSYLADLVLFQNKARNCQTSYKSYVFFNKKYKHLCLPINIQIGFLNKMVKPILLYGCEIWGFGNLDIVERVQLKFLKHILCLKKNTYNIIVYGETGTKPLSIEIKARMISFWAKLIVTNYKKLTTEIYVVALSNFKNSHSNFNFKFYKRYFHRMWNG